MKAPDINDQEFPGLPGMVTKPKSDESGEGEEGEDANGDADGAGEAGGDGEDKTEKVWYHLRVLWWGRCCSLLLPLLSLLLLLF